MFQRAIALVKTLFVPSAGLVMLTAGRRLPPEPLALVLGQARSSYLLMRRTAGEEHLRQGVSEAAVACINLLVAQRSNKSRN